MLEIAKFYSFGDVQHDAIVVIHELVRFLSWRVSL